MMWSKICEPKRKKILIYRFRFFRGCFRVSFQSSLSSFFKENFDFCSRAITEQKRIILVPDAENWDEIYGNTCLVFWGKLSWELRWNFSTAGWILEKPRRKTVEFSRKLKIENVFLIVKWIEFTAHSPEHKSMHWKSLKVLPISWPD
jgi:hypothetical protein